MSVTFGGRYDPMCAEGTFVDGDAVNYFSRPCWSNLRTQT